MPRNNLVFMQCRANSNTNCFPSLRSIEQAEGFKKLNADPKSRFTYAVVTLTDEELAQVVDENSKIKQDAAKKFNPFLPEGMEYLSSRYITEKQLLADAEKTIALGMYLKDSKNQNGEKNHSTLKSALVQNSMFDPHTIKEVFALLEPEDPSKPKRSQQSTLPTKQT